MNTQTMLDDERARLERLVADSDIIYGCTAIAAVLRMNKDRCFYFLKRDMIPGVVKIGNRYSASKRELLRAYLATAGAE